MRTTRKPPRPPAEREHHHLMYEMTFAESSVVDDVLHAFPGPRWHTTQELATHAHYSRRQTRRALRKLADDGIIEHTEHRNGEVLLWRGLETPPRNSSHTPATPGPSP